MQPSATCRTHDESHGCASVWCYRTAFHTLDVISGGSFLLRGYSLRLNRLSSEFGPCFCFSFFFFFLPWSPGFHSPCLNLSLLQIFDLWRQLWFISSKIKTNCQTGPSIFFFTAFPWSFTLLALMRSSSRLPRESWHCHRFLLAMF